MKVHGARGCPPTGSNDLGQLSDEGAPASMASINWVVGRAHCNRCPVQEREPSPKKTGQLVLSIDSNVSGTTSSFGAACWNSGRHRH